MSATVTLEDAQSRLKELVAQLAAGDEIVITENDRQVAKLVAAPVDKPRRKIGTLRGSVLYMAPDFDAPLEEFKEYME